jgi:membrane-associated phospholipid phosphatase
MKAAIERSREVQRTVKRAGHRLRSSILVLLICAPLLLPSVSAGSGSGANLEETGDILRVAMPVAAAGGAVIKGDTEGLLQFGGANALSLASTYLLKEVVDAERPDGGDRSFPSGHTAVAFCTAEFVRKRYGWRMGVPTYILAGLVGYSRVASDRHYARDVLAGAVIGAGASYLIVRSSSGLSVEISACDGTRRLALIRCW